MLKNKKIYQLVWFASLFTKTIYTFIAYNQYKINGSNSHEIMIISILFLVLGIGDVIAGIYLIKNIFKKDSFIIPLFMRLYSRNNDSESEDPHFSVYTISLGLIETSALFGLAGYFYSGDIRIFLILLTISLVAWVFAKPDSQLK